MVVSGLRGLDSPAPGKRVDPSKFIPAALRKQAKFIPAALRKQQLHNQASRRIRPECNQNCSESPQAPELPTCPIARRRIVIKKFGSLAGKPPGPEPNVTSTDTRPGIRLYFNGEEPVEEVSSASKPSPKRFRGRWATGSGRKMPGKTTITTSQPGEKGKPASPKSPNSKKKKRKKKEKKKKDLDWGSLRRKAPATEGTSRRKRKKRPQFAFEKSRNSDVREEQNREL